MKINDVGKRALKTFIQAFCGVAIPETCAILTNIANGKPVAELDWNNWYIYVIPIICGGLSAGISAAWNTIQNSLSE